MVALTYDVRTVRVPIPRLVVGVRRSRAGARSGTRGAPPALGAHRARRGRTAPRGAPRLRTALRSGAGF